MDWTNYLIKIQHITQIQKDDKGKAVKSTLKVRNQKKPHTMKHFSEEPTTAIESDQEMRVKIHVIRENSFDNLNGRNADLTVPLNVSSANSSA